jgi:flagellar basal body-associated protein FliL
MFGRRRGQWEVRSVMKRKRLLAVVLVLLAVGIVGVGYLVLSQKKEESFSQL